MASPKLSSVDDVFDLWPSPAELAGEIEAPIERVRKWKHRKSIPRSAWPVLLESAKKNGKRLTADDLLAVHQ